MYVSVYSLPKLETAVVRTSHVLMGQLDAMNTSELYVAELVFHFIKQAHSSFLERTPIAHSKQPLGENLPCRLIFDYSNHLSFPSKNLPSGADNYFSTRSLLDIIAVLWETYCWCIEYIFHAVSSLGIVYRELLLYSFFAQVPVWTSPKFCLCIHRC